MRKKNYFGKHMFGELAQGAKIGIAVTLLIISVIVTFVIFKGTVKTTPSTPASVTSSSPTPASVTSSSPTPASVTSSSPTPASVTSSSPTPAAIANTGPIKNGIYIIRHPWGGKYANFSDISINDGITPILVAPSSSVPDNIKQNWRVSQIENGNYVIQSVTDTGFLTLRMGDAQLIISAYSPSGGNYSNSEWVITLLSSNLYKIENSAKIPANSICRMNETDLSQIAMQPFNSGGFASWKFVLV